jgi:adenosylcobinamide-GDP ribazoletransferase
MSAHRPRRNEGAGAGGDAGIVLPARGDPRGWRTALRGARAAFVFLTRVPVGGRPYEPAEWAWAPAHFPMVGLVLGGALAVLHRALWPLGPLADAAVVLGASLLLTGALHEDGLADTSDALGGAYDREGIHRILKDSRVGTFGACALAVTLLGRAALLARLGADARPALLLVGCAARVGPVWQMIALPYVTAEGAKSRDLARAGVRQGVVAAAWFVVAAAIAIGSKSFSAARIVALTASLAVVTTVTAWRYRRRAGGVTGDFLGATEQLCELAGYAALVWDSS